MQASRSTRCVIALATLAASLTVHAAANAQNAYTNTILVANGDSYEPLNFVDELLVNGWGLAIRPPGAGGHFWVSNAGSGNTTVYVGDVHDASGRFTPLFQDELKVVDFELGSHTQVDGSPIAPVPLATGQVFNHSSTDFVVSGEGLSAAAKFIFVTGEGTISGWTEVRDAQGVMRRQTRTVNTVDNSVEYDGNDALVYTGCAVTEEPSGNRLYVTNFRTGDVEVYDHLWQRVPTAPGRFRFHGQNEALFAWNIQYLRTGPNGEGRLWVAYAMKEAPWEENPAFGAVAQFDLEGNFISRLSTSDMTDPWKPSELQAPWGFAVAPANFGPLSNLLLVSNFGDGTIVAYNPTTGQFVDYIRDNAGEPVSVDGIWGILFGNGVALGDTNALYYAAGPNFEFDGTFGSIRLTSTTCPVIARQPLGATVPPGATATISPEAPSPVHLTYQWQRETTPGAWSDLTDGAASGLGQVEGSTTAAITVRGASGSTNLRCILTNACGSVTTQPAMLTVEGTSRCDYDYNQDGNVDLTDAQLIARVVAGLVTPDDRWLNGDVNADGDTDLADAQLLAHSVVDGVCGV
jgi:uncharacterized protein (TIGR03118 family)